MHKRKGETMNILRFSNKKEIEIKEVTAESVRMGYDTVDDLPSIIRDFTEENLADIQIITEDGSVLMELKNKFLLTANVIIAEKTMTLWLADVDMMTKRIAQLETSLTKQKEIIAELRGDNADGK